MGSLLTPVPVLTAVISDDQITTLQVLLRDILCQRCPEFPSQRVQAVINDEGKGLQADFLAVIRNRVEHHFHLARRRVTVNRDLTPQQVLVATKRVQYTHEFMVTTMPGGGSGREDITIEFFRPGQVITDDELEAEVRGRGYDRIVDPYELSAVNEDDPAFADNHPNGTHWQDANGNWYYISFRNDDNTGCCVSIHRHIMNWDHSCWFGGVYIK